MQQQSSQIETVLKSIHRRACAFRVTDRRRDWRMVPHWLDPFCSTFSSL